MVDKKIEAKTRHYHHPAVRDPADVPDGSIVRIYELSVWFQYAVGTINNYRGIGRFPQPEPIKPLAPPNTQNIWIMGPKLRDALAARRERRPWYDPDFGGQPARDFPAKKKGPAEGP